MAESVKFTEEEMKQINNLQQSYMNIQSSLGQLAVNKIRTKKQLSDIEVAEENLQEQFTNNQKEETKFVESINKKYGDGNLDLNTGVFTPKPVEKTTDKTL
tara:strand:- start:78 stop:380 length:303 start_codon:yes stop_codon:yes gene_type:complete